MVTIDYLLSKLDKCDEDEKIKIISAYEFARDLHEGQYRQSGEPYIIHPLNVALILSEMNADVDTICAGLLHDTIEDTNTTKDEIKHYFNDDVANLVDGVTKISSMNYSSKEEQKLANSRKIITSITEDVRIIIIKLADRLHNMRTLQYKSRYKQKEISIETMELFVPLAYYIGAYGIKSELEDISFRYLKPNIYRDIEYQKIKMQQENSEVLEEMLLKINSILTDKKIPNEIKIRIKNVYGIYKKVCMGKKLSEIHDLLALKIIVDEVDNCYRTLGYVHNEYRPLDFRFKDYICNPKTNMYSSLHTTVFGPEDKIVQTQIRTFSMEDIASFGLTAYWNINKGNARDVMQSQLKEKYQFFKSLKEINKMFTDNQDFIFQVKTELLSEKVYVYTSRGDIIELPIGATPIDFAYKVDENIGNRMIYAFVNDNIVPFDYKLVNKDRVRIITDENVIPKEEWTDMAITSYAKRKINKALGR